ncbi:calcium-independent phospholipase A2-gamma-like [Convolutriloba macropyga]|uniref:calcium-independent phospholipase A2-gamma-like n=1 Tax=Convolutriloba macropyga TaxID=536237 RepID=UPI003F5228EC
MSRTSDRVLLLISSRIVSGVKRDIQPFRLLNSQLKKDSKSDTESEKNQSWDVLRNISSTFKWTDSKGTVDDSDTSSKKAQSRNNGLLKEAKVVESKVNILNDKQQSQLDISKPCLSIKGNNHDETSQKIVKKLLEASSVISKVAQLNILNEHLAKDNSFLNNAQKTALVHHLTASKDEFSKRRYQEAVRCTLNLIGMPEKPKGSGIKILCIDGGGTRGLAPLEMLAKLEKACVDKGVIKNENPDSSNEFLSQFDLICGVSTGSIVAFMTSVAGISFTTSINVYRKMASEIFQRSSIIGVGSTLTGNSWYDTDKWLKHLQSYERSFDPIYMASKEKSAPLICAVSVVTNCDILRPYVFRSYGFRPDSRSRYFGGAAVENWEVLRATTAAPFYFDPFAYEDMVLQDGGILLNNPTALAIHEARALWPNEELQLVLSMGTGLQNSIPKNDLTRPQSKQQQQKAKAVRTEYLKTFNHFIDTVTNTEVVHTTLKDLLPRGTYFRFNPRLNDSFVLDEFRAERLDELRQQTLQYMSREENRVDRFVKCFAQSRSTKLKLRDLWHQRVEQIFPN